MRRWGRCCGLASVGGLDGAGPGRVPSVGMAEQRMMRRAGWHIVIAGAGLLAWAVPVLGAEKPPAVEHPGKGSGILVYLVSALLALAAVGLCAMPSRRTHQD